MITVMHVARVMGLIQNAIVFPTGGVHPNFILRGVDYEKIIN
jgi:hypothetical protein